METKFNVNLLKGFFSNNVKSKTGCFYQIQKPIEVNMGNWAAKIKFYNNRGKLIYYRANSWGHDTSSNLDYLNFVTWGKTGDFCLFYEYMRGKVYDIVLLDFYNEVEYRISKVDLSQSLEILSNYKLKEILNIENFTKGKLQVDEITNGWFFKDRWYPEIDI